MRETRVENTKRVAIKIIQTILKILIVLLFSIYKIIIFLAINIFHFIKKAIVSFLNSNFYKKNKKMFLRFLKKKKKALLIIIKKKKKVLFINLKKKKKVFLRSYSRAINKKNVSAKTNNYLAIIFHILLKTFFISIKKIAIFFKLLQKGFSNLFARPLWLKISFFSTLGIILLLVLFTNKNISAATYTFIQNNWNGGASADIANHTSNQSMWDKFSSKDAGIEIASGGASFSLSLASASITQTNESSAQSGFGAGAFSQTEISGSGNDAYLKIQQANASPSLAIHTALSNSRYVMKSDGTIWSWGYNNFGQLGDGTTDNQLGPVQVLGPAGVDFLSDVVMVTGGNDSGYALKSDGTVWSWGYNVFGQLGDNTNVNKAYPTQVKGPGGVDFLTDVVDIKAGNRWVMALKSDGTVWTWGHNGGGQLGDNSTTNRYTPVQVQGPDGIGFLTDITFISAGSSAAYAIKSDGTLWAWGYNSYYKLGDMTNTNRSTPIQVVGPDGVGFLTDVIFVSGGSDHVNTIRSDGTVWSWGYGGTGQIGENLSHTRETPTQAVGPGGIGFLTDVVAIANGQVATHALKSDGTVWSWGSNTYGQLGNNSAARQWAPIQTFGPDGVGFLDDIIALATEQHSAHALKSDGTVYSWGLNDKGQLGNGTVDNSSVPISVTNIGQAAFYNSGTFTSSVIDIGFAPASFSTLDINTTLPANTSITIDVRAGNDSDTADASWTAWTTGLADGADISALGSKRYIQYRANFSTTDVSASPLLNSVAINYSYYPDNQTLISSKYDTLDDANIIGLIGLNEGSSLPAGTGATLSVRTASSSAELDSALWHDFTNASSGCSKDEGKWTCPSTSIPSSLKDGEGDRFWQYKVTLSSTGANTPTISEVEIKYVVNAPPEVQNVTATQRADGLVDISYEVRDVDALAGSNTPGEIAPYFEYYANGSWVTCTTLGASDENQKDVDMTNFTTYTATWNAKTDFADNYVENIKIRVTVNDGEAANNLDQAESSMFTLDTKNPVLNSVSIDGRSDSATNLHFDISDDSALKIKLSNNSNISADSLNTDSGEWIDLPASKSWIFANPNLPIVYYQIKDVFDNFISSGSILTLNAPARPLNIIFQDVSNISTTEWREFIAWGQSPVLPLGFGQYNIYRSTDGTNFSSIATQSDRSANFILDSSLNTNETYYYKVTIEDQDGNISNYSDVIYDRPDGQGGTDLTSPTISNASISSITAQSALITWDTDEPSNSLVAYITDESGNFDDALSVGISSMSDSAGRLGQHSVFLNYLDPGTTYYLRVQSSDPSNNAAFDDSLSFTTLSGPVISNVASTNITNTSATISWSSSVAADSRVFYSKSISMSNPTEVAQSGETTSHSVQLNGLDTGARYYFYVKSNVTEDRNIVDGEQMYYNFLTTLDATAPQITFNSETDIFDRQENSVRISWTTDELATSTIEYSVDDSYENVLTNDNFNTNHSFELTGLEKGTTYNFKLKNADSNNNLRVLSDLSFTTPDYSDTVEPTITSVLAKQVADVSALITWSTDEPADSRVEYGTESENYDQVATSSDFNYSHSVLLEDLNIQTTYYFRVISSDTNENSTSSEESSFTTQDALVAGATSTTIIVKEGGGTLIIDKSDNTKPTISDLQVKNTSFDRTTISWETNEPANSIVEFGLDKKYSQASVSLETKNSHSQILNGLSPSKTYYYRVSSTDSSGNISNFVEGNFTTLSLDEIGDIDDLLDPDDLDPETGDDIDNILSPEEQAKNDDNFLQILRRTFDFIKQAARSVSSSILEASLIEQQETIKELANMTDTPNIISGPTVNVWEDMAIITWETDKRTSSLIALTEEGVPFSSYDLVKNFGNPDIYANNHQVVISGLKPETSYNYQLRGATPIGSRATSETRSLSTLSKSAKIENYVIDKINDESASFKWTSSLPTNSLVRAIPYRNGFLSFDEAIVANSDNMTTIHEITVENLEPGISYQIALSGRDSSGQVLSQTIDSFSTSNEAAAFVIEQVKTSSALDGAESPRVQSIISWNTSKLSTSKVYYRKGFGQDDDNWPFETFLDPTYTKRHLVVVTDFLPGEIYQFQVESSDSNGQKIRSNTYTILTPRQRESVFQVILKNVEQTFGWVGKFNQ